LHELGIWVGWTRQGRNEYTVLVGKLSLGLPGKVDEKIILKWISGKEVSYIER
jgi:hypothetical protein